MGWLKCHNAHCLHKDSADFLESSADLFATQIATILFNFQSSENIDFDNFLLVSLLLLWSCGFLDILTYSRNASLLAFKRGGEFKYIVKLN